MIAFSPDWKKYTLSSTCSAQICLRIEIFSVHLARIYDWAKNFSAHSAKIDGCAENVAALWAQTGNTKKINEIAKDAKRVNKMIKVGIKCQQNH